GRAGEDAIPGKKQGPSKSDDLPQRLTMWLRAKRASKGATEASLPKEFEKYKYWIIKPNARSLENQAGDRYETNLLQEMRDNADKSSDNRRSQKEQNIFYYGAVRARNDCLGCHPLANEKTMLADKNGELKEGDLMAMVKIRLSGNAIDEGIHQNRAMLIVTALVTAFLIMSGSYLIVR